MIYKGKKLKIEFFDKSLNGTVRGDYKFKKAVELDSNKRMKLGTQLRRFVLGHDVLSDHLEKNSVAFVELFVQEGKSITTIIDNRNK